MSDDSDVAVMKQQIATLEKIAEKFSEQLASLEKTTVIMDVNNRELPDLKDRLRKLEEKENKRTGALAIVFVLGGIVSAGLANIKHVVAVFSGASH